MAAIDVAGLIANDIATNIPGWTVGANLFANRAPAPDRLQSPDERYCVIIPAIVERNGTPTALGRPAPFRARLLVRVLGPRAGDAFAGASEILDRYVSAVIIQTDISVWADSASPVLISGEAGGRTEYGGTLSATWSA